MPLLWIILYWFWSQKKKPSWPIVLASISLFIVVNTPLIGFDLLHDFSNLKTPLRVAQRSGGQFHPQNNFLQLSRSLGRLWYLNPYTNNADEVLHDCSPYFNNLGKHHLGETTDYSQAKWYFSVLSFGLLIWFWMKQRTWRQDETKLLALFLCSYTVFFLLLPNSPLEYYLLGFFPLFLFIPAIFIDRNWKTLIGRLMLVLVLGISILGVRTILTARSDFGLQNKINLIREVSGFLDGKTFYLEGGGLCHNYEGWRMLFKVYGQLPTVSYTDSMFGWLYPSELGKAKPQYRLTIQESRVPVNLSEQPLKTFSSGGFSAYVFDTRQK